VSGVESRVRAWDRALAAIRATLRGRGLREVLTRARVDEIAIEPWIEPIGAGEQLLRTSPELQHKRLLAGSSGAIFEIGPVWRAGETGARHREEFHLLEWYRVEPSVGGPISDVEAIVAAVFEAAGSEPPRSWRRVGFLELVERTTGVRLVGDEDADALAGATGHGDALRASEGDARVLEAWTAAFTRWSDEAFDPWLRTQVDGVHVVDFPAPLAALAEVEGGIAQRFESHLAGVELCNGYRELRDAAEQRRRFEIVAALRAAHELPPLPIPERFLATLAQPGLPACAGAALGLERLLMLATGASALDEVELV
jgi:lysyl-tRNA synthetase class 2